MKNVIAKVQTNAWFKRDGQSEVTATLVVFLLVGSLGVNLIRTATMSRKDLQVQASRVLHLPLAKRTQISKRVG